MPSTLSVGGVRGSLVIVSFLDFFLIFYTLSIRAAGRELAVCRGFLWVEIGLFWLVGLVVKTKVG